MLCFFFVSVLQRIFYGSECQPDVKTHGCEPEEDTQGKVLESKGPKNTTIGSGEVIQIGDHNYKEGEEKENIQ